MKLLLNPTAPNEIGPKHIDEIDVVHTSLNQGLVNLIPVRNPDPVMRILTHMYGTPGWHRRVLCQGVCLSLGMV
jgi:hypothetical protein